MTTIQDLQNLLIDPNGVTLSAPTTMLMCQSYNFVPYVLG